LDSASLLPPFYTDLCPKKSAHLPSTICKYKNGRTDVYLSVGMWRVNGIPNPYTDLDEILHPHSHLSKEGFGAGLTPPTPSWAWGA